MIFARSVAVLALLAGLAFVPAAAGATDWAHVTDDEASEIANSVTVDFYHEMGHALINLMDLPVLGAEEDAADTLSVYLITDLWDDPSADTIMRASLATWQATAAENGDTPDYWDVHAPDGKRIANMSCLFYGADPEKHAAIAKDFGIPEDRASGCPDEYEQVKKAWGAFIDKLTAAGPGDSIVFEDPEEATPLSDAIKEEVDYFNSILTLPKTLHVRLISCDEANAYFDPSDLSVNMCTELADQVLERMRG